MRPDKLKRRLRERLDALMPAPSAELLHVLMLPDLERAEQIGEYWSHPGRDCPSAPGAVAAGDLMSRAE